MTPLRSALITGAGGFCAGELARQLSAERRGPVVGVGRRIAPQVTDGLSDYHRCDVTNAAAVARAIRTVRPDAIFHLAGISNGKPADVLATNLGGTMHLLDAVRLHAPQAHVVIMGSAAEYGPVPRRHLPIRETQHCRPRTPYGESKLAATRAALNAAAEHRLRVSVARAFNLVGAGMPDSLVLGAVIAQIRDAMVHHRRPALVLVGRTDAQRDFVRVEDVAGALIRMARPGTEGSIFNLCTGVPTTVRTMLDLLAASLKWPIRFRRRPGATRVATLISYGSHARATKAFGFSPRTDLAPVMRRIVRIDLPRIR